MTDMGTLTSPERGKIPEIDMVELLAHAVFLRLSARHGYSVPLRVRVSGFGVSTVVERGMPEMAGGGMPNPARENQTIESKTPAIEDMG